jgi:hypothetical protein
MSELPQNEPHDLAQDSGASHRHRHRRKRKNRKKLYRKIIIAVITISVCGGALVLWHFMVQDPAVRNSSLPSVGLQA